MLLQCTKKMLDELKIKPDITPVEVNQVHAWHVNVLKEGRRKIVVFVHDISRYALVLDNLKAKELKNLGSLFQQAIRETLRAEYIKEDVIEDYLAKAPDIISSKTKDRTCVARLNKACENVYAFQSFLKPDAVIQVDISKRISKLLAGNGNGQYITPNIELYKSLEAFAGKSIFETCALELNVKLALKNYDVSRTLMVPKQITFDKLHEVMQAAFGWQDYHLHEFNIYPPDTVFPEEAFFYSLKPIVSLICDEEMFAYEDNISKKMETGERLADYLPAKIVYRYDFGDDWNHIIEVVREVDNYEHNYPKCIGGTGNTPPEDVGGERGYEEFFHIISTPNHPDLEHMKTWGKSNGYKDFDLKDINWKLKEI
ncbi:plasmid pRiA4b ORF-3 family protein [Bacillus alkalisoli]|uniref:plasmid pRiA4b ORF-3 family protein n=1 Tax=Bacillus alkalisoli TaxID=2011008 RepID=UPI000C24D051|nr:plasmid pRiA4b ORF-3 family protein [Bacillus alkalisoli]